MPTKKFYRIWRFFFLYFWKQIVFALAAKQLGNLLNRQLYSCKNAYDGLQVLFGSAPFFNPVHVYAHFSFLTGN